MAKHSQNGWPVIGVAQVVDRAILGVEFPNGWRKGDVDTVFSWLIGKLHREVEPMDNGGCWGWFVKLIEGSDTISNHASGTAFDYNAPAHPMGVRNTYTAAKREKIRAILRGPVLRGVVRWGGDYSGRPDDMHFEINDTAAAVGAAAQRIRNGDDMDAKELLDTDDVPNLYSDRATNKTVTVRTALKAAVSADVRLGDLEAEVKAQGSKLDAILAKLNEPPAAG